MAYDEEMAERLRVALSGVHYTEKKMFGGLGFMMGGHLAVSASGRGGLLVRVDPAESDQLVAEPGVDLMQMGKRPPMTGWLTVKASVVNEDIALQTWVDRGVAYAMSLPPKG